MKQQNPEANIEFESLTNEISQKSLLIARQNAQIYKLASKNQKLKKQVKGNKKK